MTTEIKYLNMMMIMAPSQHVPFIFEEEEEG